MWLVAVLFWDGMEWDGYWGGSGELLDVALRIYKSVIHDIDGD